MARRPVARVASRLDELVEAFLLSKKVSGCTDWTLTIYRGWLDRFAQTENASALDSVAVTRFFAGLRSLDMSANTIHQAYRTLKTFLRWCYDTGTMQHDPVRGFRVRLPRTLPTVPTDEEVQRVLACCRGGRVGKRNRALILIIADAGLRAAEVMHLLVEDWHPMERSLFVRSGKGRKDRTVFVNPVTSRAMGHP